MSHTSVFSDEARRAAARRLRAMGKKPRRRGPPLTGTAKIRAARRAARVCVQCGLVKVPRGKWCAGCRLVGAVKKAAQRARVTP